jgi:peptidyl-prolyl cis-trans isomerase C
MLIARSVFFEIGLQTRALVILGALFISILLTLIHAGDVKADPVVAVVNGFEFHMSDVQEARQKLPPKAQQYPLSTVFKFLLNNLVNTHLVASAARKEGLHKQAKIVAQVSRIENQILYQAYLAGRVSKAVTEEALKASYDSYLKTNIVSEEIRARHILVQTREKAIEVIDRLNKGEDFAALAKSVSTGPSGKQGGDLGYFTAEKMVPAFSQAAFQTRPGSFTEKPVKTQFGWHIIKVEDKRIIKPKLFSEARGQLRQTIAKQIASDVITELRKSADVKTFGPEGK